MLAEYKEVVSGGLSKYDLPWENALWARHEGGLSGVVAGRCCPTGLPQFPQNSAPHSFNPSILSHDPRLAKALSFSRRFG